MQIQQTKGIFAKIFKSSQSIFTGIIILFDESIKYTKAQHSKIRKHVFLTEEEEEEEKTICKNTSKSFWKAWRKWFVEKVFQDMKLTLIYSLSLNDRFIHSFHNSASYKCHLNVFFFLHFEKLFKFSVSKFSIQHSKIYFLTLNENCFQRLPKSDTDLKWNKSTKNSICAELCWRILAPFVAMC